MSLEDRLTFLEGKKAELSSIFENGVWEIETDPASVDHNRVMKARFVLKWAADGKGGLKAKARLVLQGFSDPDLLNGALDTSSPTLARTSRQVLLAISQVSAGNAGQPTSVRHSSKVILKNVFFGLAFLETPATSSVFLPEH